MHVTHCCVERGGDLACLLVARVSGVVVGWDGQGSPIGTQDMLFFFVSLSGASPRFFALFSEISG